MVDQQRGTTPWWKRGIGPALLVVAMALAPLTVAGASSSGDSGSRRVAATAADDSLATKVKEALGRFIQLWNDNKVDELVATYYTDDSILVPPNHEPIRGRAGILEYLKNAHDAVGPFDTLEAPYSMEASGDMVSNVGKISFRSHQIRFTTHERWERQPDGSVRVIVDMFGFAMP